MNALVYIHKVINKMHHLDAPLRELIKAGLDGNLQEGYGPWKATLEGLHCLPMFTKHVLCSGCISNT